MSAVLRLANSIFDKLLIRKRFIYTEDLCLLLTFKLDLALSFGTVLIFEPGNWKLPLLAPICVHVHIKEPLQLELSSHEPVTHMKLS